MLVYVSAKHIQTVILENPNQFFLFRTTLSCLESSLLAAFTRPLVLGTSLTSLNGTCFPFLLILLTQQIQGLAP
jgi:hypothetical protein